MSDRYTLEELAGKVDWEGGVDGAIEYGIKHKEVPEVLERAWREAEDAYATFREISDEISEFLNDVEVEED